MTTQVTDLVVANRMYYRKSLADFLGKVTSTPVAVLPYMPSITKLQSPLVVVTGGPTDRKKERSKSYSNDFSFGVRNIVLYSSDNQPEWLPEHAEDMLDKLEQEISIALLLADMQSEANKWDSVVREGRSVFEMLQSQGVKWLTETIPVVMKVTDEQS